MLQVQRIRLTGINISNIYFNYLFIDYFTIIHGNRDCLEVQRIIYVGQIVGQRLCKSRVLNRPVCVVFCSRLQIEIVQFCNCLKHGWLTVLKRCF